MAKNSIYRIIDANINRASEALRVIEDWTRYSNNSLEISTKLKFVRHSINSSFSPLTNLILNRDSQNDPGLNMENPSTRKSIKDVLTANFKRAEEAIRVLCEYGQLVGIDTRNLEINRYEIYSLEKELIKNERLTRLNNACLYLVTNRDSFSSDNEFLKAIEKAVSSGIDIIQLREKNETESKILSLAREIKKLTNGTEILFIINDRIDIALSADADGVHLGQKDFPISEARKILPEGFIVGLSTHSSEQGEHALKIQKPDYVGVGPVFQTPTKPDYKVAGLEYVNWAKNNLQSIPWFAIGGIDESNIEKVIEAGAKKVAVVRAIINSKEIEKVTKNLKNALKQNNKLIA